MALDTLAISRSLTDAGIEPKHADAITRAVREAAEAPADMVTKADLEAELGALRADFADAMRSQTNTILGGGWRRS
jgi:hypothetical protein